MMSHIMNKEEQYLIQDFVKMLKTLPDDRSGVNKVMDFLNTCMKTRTFIPPTAEFITVIKERKPILFQFLKMSISTTSQLYFVIQLNMNYQAALERLGIEENPVS